MPAASSHGLAWGLLITDMTIPPAFVLVPTVLGVVIVVYCLVRRGNFPAELQKFEFAGVKLEISVITSLVLIGVLIAMTGVGFYVFSSLRDVADLENQLLGAREAVLEAQHLVVNLHLEPPAEVKVESMDISRLQCHYQLARTSSLWTDEKVTRGISSRDLICPIMDITRIDVIQVLQLQEIGTGKILGQAENIYPLQPKAVLQIAP